jgi:Flp pilus assembly protein protease CpaA
MTTSKETPHISDKSIILNRVMYGAFVLFSIYYLFMGRDLADAMSNLGIALIFDPFDQKVTWSNRPLYQRVWLIAHVSIVLLMVTYLLITGSQQFFR